MTAATATTVIPLTPGRIEPMYATVGTEAPTGPGWTFEPKYDGMRVLAYATPTRVRLVTRNGKDKSAQFPEVVEALRALARRGEGPLIIDGEIIALPAAGERGQPGGGHFQSLQSRMHLKAPAEIARLSTESPALLVVFDLLRAGGDVLAREPWTERRARLEALLHAPLPDGLAISDSSRDGKRMLARARKAGWEGVIAKRVDATYEPGARSDDWRKLKLQYRAEFVVGGYTEPRRTRKFLGAILLGYFDEVGRFRYVGHTGGGFDRASLEDMLRRLAPLERATPPFVEPPRTNERAHWVQPKVVVEVKFAEWTADGRLRQPIFLGVREDKPARDVHLEKESIQWSA